MSRTNSRVDNRDSGVAWSDIPHRNPRSWASWAHQKSVKLVPNPNKLQSGLIFIIPFQNPREKYEQIKPLIWTVTAVWSFPVTLQCMWPLGHPGAPQFLCLDTRESINEYWSNMMLLFWWRDQNARHKGSYQKCLFDLIRGSEEKWQGSGLLV
jgi:hypothetical protein